MPTRIALRSRTRESNEGSADGAASHCLSVSKARVLRHGTELSAICFGLGWDVSREGAKGKCDHPVSRALSPTAGLSVRERSPHGPLVLHTTVGFPVALRLRSEEACWIGAGQENGHEPE